MCSHFWLTLMPTSSNTVAKSSPVQVMFLGLWLFVLWRKPLKIWARAWHSAEASWQQMKRQWCLEWRRRFSHCLKASEEVYVVFGGGFECYADTSFHTDWLCGAGFITPCLNSHPFACLWLQFGFSGSKFICLNSARGGTWSIFKEDLKCPNENPNEDEARGEKNNGNASGKGEANLEEGDLAARKI